MAALRVGLESVSLPQMVQDTIYFFWGSNTVAGTQTPWQIEHGLMAFSIISSNFKFIINIIASGFTHRVEV